MTHEECFNQINERQNYYVDKMYQMICDKNDILREITLESPTGTGKTHMIAKLINKLPDYYFVITSPSRSGLNGQTANKLTELCIYNNFKVYGDRQLTKNSKLTKADIINGLPSNKPLIWIRDESHLATKSFYGAFEHINFKKKIHVSATPREGGGAHIKCNFVDTLMLRTPKVSYDSTVQDALDKLKEIKECCNNIDKYNPCAIFYVTYKPDIANIIRISNEYGFKYINISDKDCTDDYNYDIDELCKDDNEYDVIITKMKLSEGIDIRRAQVAFFANEANPTTFIQRLGRIKRNALIYRDDIDIFSDKYIDVFNTTKYCYAFVKTDEEIYEKNYNSELSDYRVNNYDVISVEELNTDNGVLEISVKNGRLVNGLQIAELEGESGVFHVAKGESGFNEILENINYYDEHTYSIPQHEFKGHKTKLVKTYVPEYAKMKIPCIVPTTISPYFYVRKDDKFYKYDARSFKVNKWSTCFVKYNSEKSFYYNIRYQVPYKIVDKPDPHANIYANKDLTTKDVTDILNMHRHLEVDVSYYKSIEIDTTYKQMFINTPIYEKNKYISYNKTINDKEIAVIGTNPGSSRNVTALLRGGDYNKFYRYVIKNYKNLLDIGNTQSFSGKTSYEFNKKSLQQCLGNVVQYLAEYYIYGNKFLKQYLQTTRPSNFDLVYACIQRYRIELNQIFNVPSGKIHLPGWCTLKENEQFINEAVKLASKTAEFLKAEGIKNEHIMHDPNLSNEHIKGLADFITEDKIIDIKCTNHLEEPDIMQLLGYYYLSTKRDDLHIKELIAYDAISGKCIKINV